MPPCSSNDRATTRCGTEAARSASGVDAQRLDQLVHHLRAQRVELHVRPAGVTIRRDGTVLAELLRMSPSTLSPLEKTLRRSYDEVLASIPAALATEGFGVLTQIDVQETLRAKLGVGFRRYKILGACNPTLAHRALQVSLDVGVMLPCNVVVYEDGGATVVKAIDPTQTFAAGHPELRPIAEEVRGKLARVIAQLA